MKEVDNRGAHYYLCLYWAEALAAKDPSWQQLAADLRDAEQTVVKDFVDCQGVAVDIGMFFLPALLIIIS